MHFIQPWALVRRRPTYLRVVAKGTTRKAETKQIHFTVIQSVGTLLYRPYRRHYHIKCLFNSVRPLMRQSL
jgi:hypothetical protein